MSGNLWLIGMMGAGKTVVGRRLAERRGVRFVDTDAEVAERLGCSIGELWGRRGETAFRDMEAAQIARVARARGTVVATGGGAVLREQNVAAMRASGVVVWLDGKVDDLAARVGSGDDRPLLAGESVPEVLAALADERRSLYQHAADHRVDTGGRSVTDVVEAVEAVWT